MSLDNFYKLRSDFTLIGLTGRMGGGCNDIAKLLSSPTNPFSNLKIPENLNINEQQKFRICKDFVTNENNQWQQFKLLKYRDVLLLFFLAELATKVDHEATKMNLEIVLTLFRGVYNDDLVTTSRIGQEDKTKKLIEEKMFPFLESKTAQIQNYFETFNCQDSKIEIQNIDDTCAEKSINPKLFNKLFFGAFSDFCTEFFELIDKANPLTRQIFLQDIACNLRSNGTVFYSDTHDASNIYIVAETIKSIIKINKRAESQVRLVIDSLKNSLEINFFKERYSGFYLISSNRDFADVKKYLQNKVSQSFFDKEQQYLDLAENERVNNAVEELIDLDNVHYKIGEFKKGHFNYPDLENCIQKADYYVFNKSLEDNYSLEDESNKNKSRNELKFNYYTLEMQLLKLIALIHKPGIITPNAMERTMQLAFSSKYNSGCISRQVGAVVTDEFYSVKSIGWNEVPQGQTPCSLRSVTDLIENKNSDIFTEYEKNEGNYDGLSFRQKTEDLIPEHKSIEEFKNDLNGHNCPFCFKEFHNAFEGKDNQVHTRSLHAEENAMLQISKYGGQPLKGGNLFTTASPCELCSKKAYQLGIENVFYIDPYPGISKSQILKGGIKNPNLYMFQGAVGRGFFKLFEPYMSIKDETKLRFNLKPVPSQKVVAKQFRSILASNINITENENLIHYLDGLKDDKLIIEKVIELMNNGLSVKKDSKLE
jgi:deoxycytidylate deaminase